MDPVRHLSFRILTLLGLCFAACETSTQTMPPPLSSSSWELVWHDEFEIPGRPDPEHWNFEVGGHGWGNRELQYYTANRLENAEVRDGLLHIIAREEAWEGSSYTSARLISQGNGDFQYGRFEIRARVPAGRGTWAAIWMMPSDWTFGEGNWPDVGEIDIMEHVGHNPGVIHASAHSRDYQWQAGTQKTGVVTIPDATEAFHTYVLEWSPDRLAAYVDEQRYFEYHNEGEGWTKWPYDKPFHLILNLAIGGAWGGAEGIDNDAFPQVMEIDYVRVYRARHP